MDKKAQIKLFETIAILVVFFFLVAFGLVFYSNSKIGEYQELKDEQDTIRSLEVVKTINYLPELQCSVGNALTSNCLNIEAVKNFKPIADNHRQYYYNLFRYANISVEQIYPEKETAAWQLYVNKNQNAKDVQKIRIPISLYDPNKRRYNAGFLVVTTYD